MLPSTCEVELACDKDADGDHVRREQGHRGAHQDPPSNVTRMIAVKIPAPALSAVVISDVGAPGVASPPVPAALLPVTLSVCHHSHKVSSQKY